MANMCVYQILKINDKKRKDDEESIRGEVDASRGTDQTVVTSNPPRNEGESEITEQRE